MAEDEVFTVRNSPDLNLFKDRPPSPELKEGFEYMVLFVGTMGHQDGVSRAAGSSGLCAQGSGSHPMCSSPWSETGDAWERLQETHAALGLGDGVRFTGFISDDEMLDYMATADIGAAPDVENPLNNISTMIKTMD